MTVRKLEIYGDSVLRGVMYDTDRKRYTLCGTRADALNALCERGIETKNYSRMGATVVKGLELLTKNLPEDARGTAILLEYGGNDCDYNWKEVSENPYVTHLPKNPVDVFVSQYRALIQKIRSMNGNPVIMSLPLIDPDKFFEYLSAGLNRDNILAWLGGRTMHLYQWHEMYNVELFKMARCLQVPIIDITTPFLEFRNYSDFLCDDGIHPNEKGHALIAEAVKAKDLQCIILKKADS